LKVRPDDPEAHYNLGAALYQKGRITEAIGHFQKALEVRPDYADARRSLDAVRAQQR
jgi:tetratricopeptide (TPR) repeat protein